jgi:hypothetical protein
MKAPESDALAVALTHEHLPVGAELMDDPASVPPFSARIGPGEPPRELDIRWRDQRGARRALRITAVIKNGLDRLDEHVVALRRRCAGRWRGLIVSGVAFRLAIERKRDRRSDLEFFENHDQRIVEIAAWVRCLLRPCALRHRGNP